jgi:succinylglutamate desuccinylase
MAPGTKPAGSAEQAFTLPSTLPEFPVLLEPPDISAYIQGNTGVRGFTTRDSGLPGPHVMLVSLIHGNEIAGAIVLAEMLRDHFVPDIGRLTMGFANIAAYQRFDPKNPLASRFIEEDMNRVWDDAQLFGVRQSRELLRAREIRPLIDKVDMLLDLHSMLWPSNPLLLCGPSPRGRDLALRIASPPCVIADQGHAGGKRLIDYGHFTQTTGHAAGILVEAGQHWEPDAVQQTRATIAALLHHAGMAKAPAPAPSAAPCFAEVTQTITARTHRFFFTHAFRGGEIVPAANTLIAYDGEMEIRTPHDDCMLVMPSLKASCGHTAVRLARRSAPHT